MSNHEITQDERKAECESPARFLSWETGEITSLEEALQVCDEVDTCQLNCKCKLREAYHFYLNELHNEYK